MGRERGGGGGRGKLCPKSFLDLVQGLERERNALQCMWVKVQCVVGVYCHGLGVCVLNRASGICNNILINHIWYTCKKASNNQ